MKNIIVALALTAAFTGTAFAADLPVKARPMMSAPVAYSWSGCYLGAGAGYGMWNQDHQTLDPAGVPFRNSPQATTGGRGWFGTAQVGCDYQFSPRWVVGAFADVDFGRLKGTFTPSVSNTLSGEEKERYSWAAGGRLGYVIFPQLLGYVAGGYTQARFDSTTLVDITGGTPVTMAAQNYRGWFLASGYEYGLDFLPGLFWKTEYRYAQYRAESVGLFGAGGGLIGFERSEKDIQTIRSELVYRFNWGGGPVVAKY